jgi:uncharacterized protein YejL (UPF0352 family)
MSIIALCMSLIVVGTMRAAMICMSVPNRRAITAR